MQWKLNKIIQTHNMKKEERGKRKENYIGEE